MWVVVSRWWVVFRDGFVESSRWERTGWRALGWEFSLWGLVFWGGFSGWVKVGVRLGSTRNFLAPLESGGLAVSVGITLSMLS